MHNLIANLIRFNLQNSPLDNIDAVIVRLNSISALAAEIDTSGYIKLLSGFTKLKDGMQYSQLSKLEQSREQVLLCIKVVLETNLRVRALAMKVQALSRSNRVKIVAPIIIMHNEFEAAATKFFSQDCMAFAKAENVKAIFVEPLNATMSDAITQLPIFPMNFIPTYSGEDALVWQDAASNFDILNVLINSRAKGFASSAALASLKYKGRVIIYCKPFEVNRICKEFFKINNTSVRTISLADPESVTIEVNALLKKYQSTMADLEKTLLLLETLNYSNKDRLFDSILKKGVYELNFIWVGPNTMPISQRENLVRIKMLNPNSTVQIWTVSSFLNVEMKNFFVENQFNLVEINQLLDPIKYPKTCAMVGELLLAKTLWSAVGDILKFLILTRSFEIVGLTKRYYMEADNEYYENLNLQAKQREFMHQYMENAFGVVEVMNVDSYYINLATTIGTSLQVNAPEHLEHLLSDPIINEALMRIIKADRELGFSLENVVIDTFGRIPSTLCKGLFAAIDLDFRKFAEPKLAFQIYEGRSWVSAKAKEPMFQSQLEAEAAKDSMRATEILFGYFEHIAKTPGYWKNNNPERQETKLIDCEVSKKPKLLNSSKN